MMNNARVTWPLVALIMAMMAAVTVALILGKPVEALVSLVNTIMLALLYGEVKTVQQQTNGSTHRLMSIVERSTGTGPPEATVNNGQSTMETNAQTLMK